MERGSSFEALRRLTVCFEKLDARAARKLVVRLGAVAVPMLARELAAPRPPDEPDEKAARGELAAALFSTLVAEHPELRDRALREVHAIEQRAVRAIEQRAEHAEAIKARATALAAALAGLAPAGSLGASGAVGAGKQDEAAQRQNALSLAEQLHTPADVAAAADLMTKQLDGAEMLSLLEVMSETSPEAAAALLRELSGRVDLESGVRSELRALAAAARVEPPASADRPRRASRAGLSSTILLDDDKGSQVVVAVRRRGAQRRWRRFAVLIGVDGAIEDCLYEDDVPAAELGDPMTTPLLSGLVAEGFRVIAEGSDGAARARTLAAEAARRAAAIPHRLTSAYFLGRDILELGDVHLGPRNSHGELASAIGRAVDLLAAGEVLRAKEVAARCARVAPDDPDVASTLGQCHLAAGELTAAAEWLARAAAAEPHWPMHHWNLAAVHHRADCPEACAEALAAFLAAAEQRGEAAHDRELDERVAMARRYVAAHRPNEATNAAASEATRPPAQAPSASPFGKRKPTRSRRDARDARDE